MFFELCVDFDLVLLNIFVAFIKQYRELIEQPSNL